MILPYATVAIVGTIVTGVAAALFGPAWLNTFGVLAVAYAGGTLLVVAFAALVAVGRLRRGPGA